MKKALLLVLTLLISVVSFSQLPALLKNDVVTKPNCQSWDSAVVKLVFSSGVDTAHQLCLNRQFDTIVYSANRDTATVMNLKYDTSTVFSLKGTNGWDSNFAKYAYYAYGWLHDELKVYIDSSKSNCVTKVPIDTVKIISGARWLSGTPFYANACGRKDTIDLDFLGPSPVLLTVKNASNVNQTFHKFSAHDLCFGSAAATIYKTCTNNKFSIKMADGCPAVESGQLYNAGNWAFHVYVQPIYNPDTVHHVVCKGDSIQFSSFKMKITGNMIFTDFIESNYGCDSTRLHSITVVEPFDSAMYDTTWICKGDTAFFADGSFALHPITDTSIVAGNAICDSVIITTVYQYQQPVTTLQDTICHGQWYYFLDGDSASESSVDTSILQSALGCDSTIITSLTVFYNWSTDTLLHHICEGDSILIGSYYVSNSSFVTDTSTNGFCDTIRVNKVEVFNPFANPTFVQVNICPGDTAYFADSTYTTIAFRDTLALNGGNLCDSIIITTVGMLSPSLVQYSDTICLGGVYTFPDGDTSIISRTDTSILTGANGCDSVVIVHLWVNPTSLVQLNAQVCFGSWYVFPDGDSSNLTTVDTSSFSNRYGCDSLIVVNLNVNMPSFTNVQVDVCQGEWYVFPDGDSLNKAGTDTSSFLNQFGCDSIIYTQVSLVNIDSTVTVITDSLKAIQGFDSYQWLSCSGGSFTVLPGDTSFKLVPGSSGSYAVVIGEKHCVDTSECKIIAVTPIIIQSINDNGKGVERIIYPNPFDEYLILDPKLENARIIIYNIQGQNVFEINHFQGEVLKLDLPEGKYVLEVYEKGRVERFKLLRK